MAIGFLFSSVATLALRGFALATYVRPHRSEDATDR
jgi:hypothetical protein